MRNTKIIWSERLQARIRVEDPFGPYKGYDKHFWEFVDPADEASYCERMAESQAEQARSAKADARWHCRQARIARTDGRKRHIVEHLTEAVRLTRTAHRVGGQARLNGARADRLRASLQQAAE